MCDSHMTRQLYKLIMSVYLQSISHTTLILWRSQTALHHSKRTDGQMSQNLTVIWNEYVPWGPDYVTFCNRLAFCGEGLLAPHPISKLPPSACYIAYADVEPCLHSQLEDAPRCGDKRASNTHNLWIQVAQDWFQRSAIDKTLSVKRTGLLTSSTTNSF
jgi:hypothetical protein